MYLKEYIENFRDENPLILDTYISTDNKNPVRTIDFQKNLAEYMELNHGNLSVSTDLSGSNALNYIKRVCTSVYRANEYKYITLYATETAEYNPMENYDMTEESTTTSNGGENRSMNYNGESSREMIISGSESKEFTKEGESTTSSVQSGGHTESSKQDPVVEVTNNSRNSFNSAALVQDTASNYSGSTISNFKSIEYNDEKTESTESFRDRRDVETTTFSDRTNTEKTTFKDRSDVENINNNSHVTSALTRHGNIGVMSAQQLIEQSRQISDFSMLKLVTKDLIRHICISIY